MATTSESALLRREDVSRTCFACHPQQRTEFRRRSHMPVLEGEMTCVDCHAPHGSNTDPLLRGDTVNQTCTRCHAEKRGPFLFEHAPVTESCLNCHHPHGSNHQSLLRRPPPFLCQSCHAQIGAQQHVTNLLTRGNLAPAVQPDERLINRTPRSRRSRDSPASRLNLHRRTTPRCAGCEDVQYLPGLDGQVRGLHEPFR